MKLMLIKTISSLVRARAATGSSAAKNQKRKNNPKSGSREEMAPPVNTTVSRSARSCCHSSFKTTVADARTPQLAPARTTHRSNAAFASSLRP